MNLSDRFHVVARPFHTHSREDNPSLFARNRVQEVQETRESDVRLGLTDVVGVEGLSRERVGFVLFVFTRWEGAVDILE